MNLCNLIKLRDRQTNEQVLNSINKIINNLQSAQAERFNIRTLTRDIPDVEAELYEIFGCHYHGSHNCEDWICQSIPDGVG